jgi:hypothetical protein
MNLHRFFISALIAFPFTAIAACPVPVPVQSTQSDAAKKLPISKLNQFLKCDASDPVNDQSPCNTFAGKGLEALYGVNDFKTPTGYLSANQIADFVASSDHWVALGAVFDEDNNICAQATANQGYPVIAVMKGTVHGHVAMVLPGELARSGTWGFLAANSASFLFEHPDKVYVSGPLSKAFGPDNAKNATFYYRKID